MESETPSKENGSSLSKVASFFIGFLVIILMGIFIKKKDRPEQRRYKF